MLVDIVQNRQTNDPEDRIAVIQFRNTRFGDFTLPCMFPRNVERPPVGKCEVMFTGVLWPQRRKLNDRGEWQQVNDYSAKPRIGFIREPTADDIKVLITGFEVAGDNGYLRSFGARYSPTINKTELLLITPGRMENILHFCDNQGNTSIIDREPKIPGITWVRVHENRKPKLKVIYRLEGISNLDLLDFHGDDTMKVQDNRHMVLNRR